MEAKNKANAIVEEIKIYKGEIDQIDRVLLLENRSAILNIYPDDKREEREVISINVYYPHWRTALFSFRYHLTRRIADCQLRLRSLDA